MATASAQPKQGFRLSQLIYDTRYRSITIQVVAFILIGLFIMALISNLIQNLSDLGKDINYEFLGQRSGYDINQRLIEYTSDRTHGRAAFVGILNTLLVAALGCLAATVIGVLVGVLRLSKNWLVSTLMAIYVEGFRNVPLVLWILLIFAIFTESTPQPREFREGGSAQMLLRDSIAITNRGTFVPAPQFDAGMESLEVVPENWHGFLNSDVNLFGITVDADALVCILLMIVIVGYTVWKEGSLLDPDSQKRYKRIRFWSILILGVLALVFQLHRKFGDLDFTVSANFLAVAALFLGCFAISRLNVKRADRIQAATGNRPSTWWFTALILIVPTGLLMWYLGFTLVKPTMGGFNFTGGLQLFNSFLALWLALSLYTASFIAEIVRAGILSVSKGQTEASYALGLRPGLTMNKVILPQAMRVVIPPLISQYLNLTKNSSLAIAVGYMDVKATLGGITINQTGRELEGMLLMGLFYLALSLAISGVMNIVNERMKLVER